MTWKFHLEEIKTYFLGVAIFNKCILWFHLIALFLDLLAVSFICLAYLFIFILKSSS